MENKITFREWLAKTLTGQEHTNRELLVIAFTQQSFTSAMAGKLVDMLESMYNFYDIGSTIEHDNYSEMFVFLLDTFNQHRDYYTEVITNYTKAYDYSLNNKRVVNKTENLNMEGIRNINDTREGKHTEYELPNRVIDDNYESTPSAITKDSDTNESTNNYNNNTDHTSRVETEFNNEFIDLKNKYMRQIRNVYQEFAEHFKDCFYIIY